MKKIEIISMVKIDGKWFCQEDFPPEEFDKILKAKMDKVMHSIGFERINTE